MKAQLLMPILTLLALAAADLAQAPALAGQPAAQSGAKHDAATVRKTVTMRHVGARTIPAGQATPAKISVRRKSGRRFAKVHFRHR